jgi:hypothetical protein
MAMNEFAKLRASYSPDNIRQLNDLTALTERRLQEFQKNREFLKLYVATAFEIAIEIKRATAVNICTLAFPVEVPPLPESHPLMVALGPLDGMITSNFDTLAIETRTRIAEFDNLARVEMGLVWKGYLLTLNTPPQNWFTYNYAALGCLRILATVSGANAIEVIEERGLVSTNGVDPMNWPPPGFFKVYFQNRDRLVSRSIIADRGAMFIAKLTGVFPQGVKGFEPIAGIEKPTETKEFTSEEAAKAWLLGDGLHDFQWPVFSVEILNLEGQQVWGAYHASNDVLKNKNEVWWYEADPGRTEREKAAAERRASVKSRSNATLGTLSLRPNLSTGSSPRRAAS